MTTLYDYGNQLSETVEMIQDLLSEGVSTDDERVQELLEKMVSDELTEKFKEAEKVLSEVKKDPTAFAKIAKNVSDDVASAKQGGDFVVNLKDTLHTRKT